MMKKCKIWAVSLLCFLFFTGCRAPLVPQPPDLVTQVNVNLQHQGQVLQRRYTATEKIDVFLYYLYGLRSQGTPKADPERLVGDRCVIQVITARGNTHTYRLWCGKYLSADCRPWKKIDPQQGALLFPLIRKLQSDSVI